MRRSAVLLQACIIRATIPMQQTKVVDESLTKSLQQLNISAAPVIPGPGSYNILPTSVKEHYKAAGVLPFCTQEKDGVISKMILLGKELRKKETVWCEFGGKVESYDESVENTALREFLEETGGFYSDLQDDILKSMRENSTLKVWNANGKYVLYVVHLPYKNIEDGGVSLNPDAKTELRWFDIKDVESCAIDYEKALRDDARVFRFFLSTLKIGKVLASISSYNANNIPKSEVNSIHK